MSKTLNAITKNTQDLERLEGIIERGRGSFIEVGNAMIQIRDQKYYREVLGFETFEEYCHKRWDMGRNYMNKLIAAAAAVENLGTMVPQNMITERQIRPLINLEPDEQRKIWQMAVETAPDSKVTAAHVSKIVKEMTEAATNLFPVSPRVHAGQVSGHGVSCLDTLTCQTHRSGYRIGMGSVF